MRFVGLDPSTKTGIVILDKKGNVILEKEITSSIKEDPQRFIHITEQILEHLKDGDKICIEGFSYGSRGRGVSTQYGIGWTIRTALFYQDVDYTEVTPGGLKKFATGKGNTSKDNMILPIYKRWGYEHKSDNVRDAFVLAQISRAMHEDIKLTKFQKEVIEVIKK